MNIFAQIIKSLYLPQVTAKFRFQGIGKTILYIFVLMLITFSTAAYQLGTTVSNAVNEFDTVLKNEFPDFELTKSTLKSDLNDPLTIKINGDNFIFDSTGTLTVSDIEQEYNQALALLKKDVIFITDGVAQSFQYRELGNVNLTKPQLEELTTSIRDLLPIIITIITLILYIVLTTLKFIGIFVLSIFGIIVKRNLNVKLSYKQTWILSAYAVTLPTLFFMIIDAFYIYIPFAFTLYWAVAIIMLYLIVKEIPKTKTED